MTEESSPVALRWTPNEWTNEWTILSNFRLFILFLPLPTIIYHLWMFCVLFSLRSEWCWVEKVLLRQKRKISVLKWNIVDLSVFNVLSPIFLDVSHSSFHLKSKAKGFEHKLPTQNAVKRFTSMQMKLLLRLRFAAAIFYTISSKLRFNFNLPFLWCAHVWECGIIKLLNDESVEYFFFQKYFVWHPKEWN